MEQISSSLEKLHSLLAAGVLTQAEFDTKRQVLVDQFVGIAPTTPAPAAFSAGSRGALPGTAYFGAARLIPLGRATRGAGRGRGVHSRSAVPQPRSTPYPVSNPQRQLLGQSGTAVKVHPIPAGVDEQQLIEVFSAYGEVVSAAIHRGTPPYAHVNFATREVASAVAALDRFDWGGQICFVSLSRRRWATTQEGEPSNGIGIFNLPLTMTKEGLVQLLAPYPGLIGVKMVFNKVTPSGRGGEFRGYAFAYFDTVETASLVKSQLLGMQLEDQILDVKYSNKPAEQVLDEFL